MKQWKVAALGFVAGIMAMATTPVLANAYKTVEAYLMYDVMFNIEDKVISSTSDQPVLNYNGYTYVPTRFIAEYLGCEVSFDPTTKKVVITPPEPEVVEKVVEKEVEKVVYVDKSEDPDYVVYSKLPVTIYQDGYEIVLRTVMMDDEEGGGVKRTRTYVTVKNTDVDRIELMPWEAVLTLDGKKYDVSSYDDGWADNWNEKIREDTEREGYLLFNGIDNKYSQGSLEFTMRVNDGSGDSFDDIKIDFKK